MATSYRVAAGLPPEWEVDCYSKRRKGAPTGLPGSHDDYLLARKGKAGKQAWSIYKDATEYSQVSGQVMKLGAVVRRYDPYARSQEGKLARFSTKEEAIAYIEEWL